MSPSQAIQTATTVAAEIMGWQNKIGFLEIKIPSRAVSGDPLQDSTELQGVKFVMKGGKLFATMPYEGQVALQHTKLFTIAAAFFS